jgi:hypothetical protein
MNGTNHFKQTIREYLEQRAAGDALFAVAYAKPNKNIDHCITYILNTIRKSSCYGFTDDEVYSMAVHYYDEDNIDVGKPFNCQIFVNHTVELSEEEKLQAHKEAAERVYNEAYNKLAKRPNKPQAKQNHVDNRQYNLNLF